MSARQERLAKLGIATHTEAIKQKRASHALIEAWAAMLDAATAKPPKKQRPIDDPSRLPFGPGKVFEELEKHCSDVIQMRPYNKSTFGRLGRALCDVQGIELADLDRVVAWIQSGGLATWPVQVTWNHVCRHLTNWIATARAWESSGGRDPLMAVFSSPPPFR